MSPPLPERTESSMRTGSQAICRHRWGLLLGGTETPQSMGRACGVHNFLPSKTGPKEPDVGRDSQIRRPTAPLFYRLPESSGVHQEAPCLPLLQPSPRLHTRALGCALGSNAPWPPIH